MKAFLALATIAVGFGLAGAQTPGEVKKGEPGKKVEEPAQKDNHQASGASKAVHQLHTAYEMVALGREKKMPELMVAGATVIGMTDVEEGKAGEKSKVEKAATFDPKKEADEILKEALKMPDDSGLMDKLVAKARREIAEGKRGPIEGRPRTYSGHFSNPANRSDDIGVNLRGGEWTDVALLSLTGTDLDLEIYDPYGNIVTRQNSASPDEFYSWFVQNQGNYIFRVINYNTNAYSRYTLTVR